MIDLRPAADRMIGLVTTLTDAQLQLPTPCGDANVGDLADTWSNDEAWGGSTWVGGTNVPAEIAGVIALDELLIHGWDLSTAIGHAYDPPSQEVEAATAFVSNFDAPRDGRLFGPMVAVDSNASAFERLLGLTGRDPRWRPTP